MAEPEENPESIDSPPDDFETLAQKLEIRCKAANIPFSKDTDTIDEQTYTYCVLSLPNGREKRTFTLSSSEALARILSIPFEKFTFIGDYDAICCYEDSFIEAPLRPLGTRNLGDLKRSLQKKEEIAEELPEDSTLLISLNGSERQAGKKIVIGKASKESNILGRSSFMGRGTTLRLEGFKVSTHDEALNVLESISGSLFLQIDLIHNIPLGLFKKRKLLHRLKRNSIQDKTLVFPDSSFDKAPLSLYFYGRSAGGMPLLQFLAYYQTIEFYFPTFSQADALRKIGNLLKDPTFRRDRESDLARLLSTTQAGGQSGFGDERSQLRATILECVDPNELRAFLEMDPQAKDFFSSKAKGLTDHKLPISNLGADLRNDVADRIYDIRCKVVHTKSGVREGEIELLLPFSKEAGMLQYDIDLVQFIASKVLISASSAITNQ